MNLFNIWLFSIVATYIVKVKFSIDLNKDVADKGYILDLASNKLLYRDFNLLEKIIYKIRLNFINFIPVVNLGTCLLEVFDYYGNMDNCFRSFLDNGLLKRMTKEELEEYSKSSNGFKSFKIANKRANEMNKNNYGILDDGTVFWFKINGDDIEIIDINPSDNFEIDEEALKKFIKLTISNDSMPIIKDDSILDEDKNSYHFSGYEKHEVDTKGKVREITKDSDIKKK